MNWTVGPHPSRVYWRRRLLLGVPVLLIVLLIWGLVSCGSNDGGDARLAGVSPTAAEPTTPDPGSAGAGSAPVEVSPGESGASVPAPTSTSTCDDAVLKLVAEPAAPTVRIGSFAAMHLLVTNTSSTACNRDLGSAQQELHILSGTKQVWSSDDCSSRADAAAAQSIRTIQPGGTFDFYIRWGGTTSSPGCVTGAPVTPGKFELVAKLGTLESKPAAFTVTT